ncbi:MAG: carboxypeptidase-like regulatory domain-containing protein, partial [Bacteroidota bacterium]
MKIFQLLLLILLSTYSKQVFGQSVYGKVQDSKGQEISFVRISVEGSSFGTITDDKGEYELKLAEGTYKLTFQHLNYYKLKKSVKIQGNTRLDVELSLSGVQLNAIEITANKKDPAYAIMKEVIANKKNNLKQFNSYSSETYQKIKLETDTLPSKKEQKILADSLGLSLDELPPHEWKWRVSKLIESQSTIYFKRPGNYKTVVNAFRDFKAMNPAWGFRLGLEFSGQGDYRSDIRDPYLFYTDVSDADINFYRNLIKMPDLGDRPFISPLHSTNWRLIYSFKLEETFFEEGRVNYRIR